jgi:hypothetical protein
VTLYFLTDLGERHRDVVRVTAGQAHVDKVLTSTERALTLTVPQEMRPSSGGTRWTSLGLRLGLGAITVAALTALQLLRRRRRR